MPRQPAPIVNAFCAALVLAVLSPVFAQSKPPSHVGSTRDQVIEKLGEPKNNLQAGTREVLIFSKLKLTLRNGVVIESEILPDEPPVERRAPEPTPASKGAPASAPAENSNQPAASAASNATSSETVSPPNRTPPVETPPPPVRPEPPREAPLEIKLVKSGKSSPGAKKTAPASPVAAKSTPPAVADSKPAAPSATTPSATTPPASASTPRTAPTTVAGTAPAASAPNPTAAADRSAATAPPETPPAAEEPATTEAAAGKAPVDLRKRAAIFQRWRLRRDAEVGDEPVQIFSKQSYVIAALTLLAGAWYLWWRRSQRNLAMFATAVSHAPFQPIVGTDTAGQFSADFVAKLGAKRFERLVASYYAKTGVVAEQTNAGADSPVHIKIFWKGEAKPFAGVQCQANPPTLIGVKPLQDLFAALSTAEIRRGYIVTTGKFNVEARDYAEEKHFTLLSGDLFLEKLNALPAAARGELLKETNTEEPAAPTAGTHAT